MSDENLIEIRDRLSKMETLLETSLKHQHDLTQKLAHTVYGNGKPGIATEVALLKRAEEKRGKREFYLFCAVIGAWIKMVFDHVMKGG